MYGRAGRTGTRAWLAGACLLCVLAPGRAQELPTADQGTVELTPLAAARMALDRNLDLQAQAEAVAQVQAQVQQAFAIVKLKADLQASAMRLGPVTGFTLPPEMDGGTIKLGAEHSERATLSVTQPLYTGKRVQYAVRLAREAVDAVELGYDTASRSFALAAQETAYGVLRARQLAAVAEARVNAVGEHVKQAQALQEEGVVPQFDVVQAQAELARAQGDLIAARTAIEQLAAALRKLISLPQTTELLVIDGPSLPRPDGLLPDLIGAAWEQRPEVKVAEAEVRLAHGRVQLAGVDLSPTVALTGQYTRQNATGTTGDYSWQVGLVVAKPLLDGGAKSAKVREAQAKVRAAEFSVQSVKEQVALEVHQYLLSVDEARQRIETAQQGVTEATERQRMAQLRYREGLTVGIEVLDAETALAAAEANLVNAQYDLSLAIVRLRSAMGIVDAEEVPAE